MPSGKSGCVNCSRRRITCDGGKPECEKCRRKGLACPGYGQRIRFNNGVASRGKLRPLPADCDAQMLASTTAGRDQGQFVKLVWPDDDAERAVESNGALVLGSTAERQFRAINVPAPIESVDARSRELFAHFSQAIAPIMVVLDGKFNGYRDLLLPLACEEPLVKAAVMVTSMYHLSMYQPEMRARADAGYSAIIRRLRHDAENAVGGNAMSVSAWSTILILLTGETVSGGINLPYLFRMLQSLAASNENGEGPSVLKSFLSEQTKMMTLFAQPLLGETESTMAVVQNPDQYFDFLSNISVFHPTRTQTIELYKSAIRQACAIYQLGSQASNSVQNDTWRYYSSFMSTAVDDLQNLCLQIQPDDPGHHTLVWVYFIGAAESRTIPQREFFILRLEDVFKKTKFNNIPSAIAALKQMWASQGDMLQRWTEVLPNSKPVFII